MTNKERLVKLEKAMSLIREVEFSYTPSHPIRCEIYRIIVNTFAVPSFLASLIKEFREEK